MGTLRLSDAEWDRLHGVRVTRRPSVVDAIGAAQRRAEDWPATLAAQCRMGGLPIPEREYAGIPGRRFRFDLAFPSVRVAVEVDGGVYAVGEDGQQGGRHQRPAGFEADCEKLSLAAAHGWRVLKVTPSQVRSGKALEWLQQALYAGPPW